MSKAKYRYSVDDFDYDAYLERRKKKAGGQGGQSILVDASKGSNPSDHAAGKQSASTKSASGTVQVTTPAGASAQTGCSEKQLLCDDTSLLKSHSPPAHSYDYESAAFTAYSSYQYTLFMKEQLRKLGEELQGVKNDRAALEENLRLAKEELCKGKTEWANTEAYLWSKLTSNAVEISRLKAELAKLKESKEQEIKDACYETAIEIKGKMSQQYLDGEACRWPHEENISLWRKLQEFRRGATLDDDHDSAGDDSDAHGGE